MTRLFYKEKGMKKAIIMDEAGINRAVMRITHEIIERNKGVKDVVLLGVKTRGIPLSKRIQENIAKFEGVLVPCGELDITLHRDDISADDKKNAKDLCKFPCDVTGKTVIIVDDVMHTGRTIRAGIEAIFAKGRPQALQLVTLIDRGHRELPIRPDYVGKNVPTSNNEFVSVLLKERDGENGVYIVSEISKEQFFKGRV